MPQQKFTFLSYKTLLTLILFFIGSLHAMIFTFFQLPNNYEMHITFEYKVYAKFISYAAAILASIFHNNLTIKLGVKNIFVAGLTLNLVGLILILLSWVNFPNNSILYLCILLAFLSFGLAILSVINSLITYLISEHPNSIFSSIIVLFLSLNVGIFLSPILFSFFNYYDLKWGFILLLMVLSLGSIFSVIKLFTEPKYPKHIQQLKKSSSLWKDLHYRLAFFMLAAIFYGIIENTISIWGENFLSTFIESKEAITISSLFWLFQVIGQLLVLIPLYYINPKIIFSILCGITLVSLWGLYKSLDPFTIALFISIGGIGCSAMLPLIIASLGKQIIKDSKKILSNFLPYIELGCSYILAGYALGYGLIDFLNTWDYKQKLIHLPVHFYYAIWAVLGMLIIYLFIEMYAKVKKTRVK